MIDLFHLSRQHLRLCIITKIIRIKHAKNGDLLEVASIYYNIIMDK